MDFTKELMAGLKRSYLDLSFQIRLNLVKREKLVQLFGIDKEYTKFNKETDISGNNNYIKIKIDR